VSIEEPHPLSIEEPYTLSIDVQSINVEVIEVHQNDGSEHKSHNINLKVFNFENHSFESLEHRIGERFSDIILDELLKREKTLQGKREDHREDEDMTTLTYSLRLSIRGMRSAPMGSGEEEYYKQLAPVIIVQGSIEYSDSPEHFLAHIRVLFVNAELTFTPIMISQVNFRYEQMRTVAESEAAKIYRAIEDYFGQVTEEAK